MQFSELELDNLKNLPEREARALQAQELLTQVIELLSGLDGWNSHYVGYALQGLNQGRHSLEIYIDALKEYGDAYKEYGGGPYIGKPPVPALDRLLSDEDL